MIFASHPSKGKKIKLDPFDLIRGKKSLDLGVEVLIMKKLYENF